MKTIRNLFRLMIAMIAFAIFPHESMATVEGRDCTAPPTNMVIQYGDVMAGSNCNLPVGGSGLFRFQGNIGESLVAIGSRANGGYICIELFGPDGLHTTNGALQCMYNSGQGSMRIDETLKKNGTHTIRISEAGNDGILEYRVTLERSVPSSPTATVINDAVISGEINLPSDLDPYVFGAHIGDVVSIVASRTGCGYVCVELIGPDGLHTHDGALQCMYNSGQGSMRIDDTLSADGTYTILVSESGNDGTLNYTVNFDCITGCNDPPPPLPCKGDFDHDRDVDNVDAFQFRKEFGRRDCPL